MHLCLCRLRAADTIPRHTRL